MNPRYPSPSVTNDSSDSMGRRKSNHKVSVDEINHLLVDHINAKQLEESKSIGELFAYEYDSGRPFAHDRGALFIHRELIKHMFELDPIGIWKKSLLQKALKKYVNNVGTEVTKNMDIRTQCANWNQLFIDCRGAKKNCASGVKIAPWLKDIYEVMACPKFGDCDDSGCNICSINMPDVN